MDLFLITEAQIKAAVRVATMADKPRHNCATAACAAPAG
jgi:hypothetical protein